MAHPEAINSWSRGPATGIWRVTPESHRLLILLHDYVWIQFRVIASAAVGTHCVLAYDVIARLREKPQFKPQGDQMWQLSPLSN
jgi:hypothetical protein